MGMWRGRMWRTGCKIVGGWRFRGRPKKTWEQSVKCDIRYAEGGAV